MTLNRYLEHDRGTKGVLSLSPRENTSLPVRNDWSNWRSFHVEAEVEKNRNLGRNQRNFSKKFDQISTDLSRSRRNGMRSLYFPCIVKNNPSNEKSTRFKWVLQKSIKWTRLFEKPIKCYSHTLPFFETYSFTWLISETCPYTWSDFHWRYWEMTRNRKHSLGK